MESVGVLQDSVGGLDSTASVAVAWWNSVTLACHRACFRTL